MTIKCPYSRLRVAASLAPLPGRTPTDFALSFLARAVNEFADRDADTTHGNLLERARDIITQGPTEERWRDLSAELVTVNHERKHADPDHGKNNGLQWYQRGDMA